MSKNATNNRQNLQKVDGGVMKTAYTHTGIVKGNYGDEYCVDYRAPLRRVGKWWETKGGRRFDGEGRRKGYFVILSWGGGEPRWSLDISTIERVRTK